MRKLLLIISILIGFVSNAQLNVNRLLVAGVEDAQVFTESYFTPGLDALAISITNGWFSSAKSKKNAQFEFSFIGNFSVVNTDQKKFQLNTTDYQFLQFQNGSAVQRVANILGENNPEMQVAATFLDQNGNPQNIPFHLPQGISDGGLSVFPTIIPQFSIGFFGGFEFKLRYLPEIEINDVDFQMYGVGLQHELSKWFPVLKSLPLHFGIAANYTRLMSDIKFGETPIVESENATMFNKLSAWSVSAITSTKFLVINFYAGITYVNAETDFGFRGDYNVQQGVIAGTQLENPFTSSSLFQGFRGTLGARLNLAVFRINVDYSIQKFNTLSVGISFGT